MMVLNMCSAVQLISRTFSMVDFSYLFLILREFFANCDLRVAVLVMEVFKSLRRKCWWRV